MNRFLQRISITIILVSVVCGCQTSVPPKTEIVQPTIAPSPSLTPVPSTLSPVSTANTLPSLIPDSAPVIAEPSPTAFLLKTKFPKACQEEYYDEYTKISPSGDWLAESCFSNGIMQVSDQAGTKVFVVSSKDYFSDPSFPDLTGSVKPVHWTIDSQFIYFTAAPEQWNDGGFRALGSFAPLLGRMSIENGETAQILSGTFYHSFSPTDRRLIEVQQFEHPINLIVHDLKTGESQMFTPDNNSKYSQAASVVWSPDGLKFVFIAAFGGEYGDEVYGQPNIQSLILIDLESLSQHIIVSETSDFIEPLAWDGNKLISYRIMNYDDRYKVTNYLYDYQKEEITVLPTITP